MENSKPWSETLFDVTRDREIRGTTTLSDLQRRAFERPKDYLAAQPVVEVTPIEIIEAAVTPEISSNQYATIFADRQNSIHGDVVVTTGHWYKFLSPKEWGKKMGTVMIAISLFGLMYISLPVAIAEVSSQINKVSQARLDSIEPNDSHVILPSPSPLYPALSEKNTFSDDELYRYKDFRLVIPKIGLESVIIKNVDPNNVTEYSEQLSNGVAHAKGSYLPGEDGTMFLFAHSTDAEFNVARYNAKFYAVRKLEVGDEIVVRYGEKIYKYQVKDKKVISPDELDKVRESGYKLVLSTCYPPGTDWQRLVVFADEVVDN